MNNDNHFTKVNFDENELETDLNDVLDGDINNNEYEDDIDIDIEPECDKFYNYGNSYKDDINDWLLTEFDRNQINDDVIVKIVNAINNYFNQFNVKIVNTKFINQLIPLLYNNSI